MDIIVAACVSQFHDSEDEFELLLAYNDGREIGHAMTRSAARQIADEIVNAIGDSAPDRRTVAGQQSGVSSIEAIEKAMEGVTHGDWYLAGKLTIRHTSPVGGADGWIGKVNWRNGEANATYIAACNPAAMREVLALARQAEALKRENAEKDARIAALEAGIRPFSKYAGVVFERNFNSSDPVDTMTATDGAVSTLYARDFFSARALLGGTENAGN